MKNVLEIDGVFLEFGNRQILNDVYFKNETGKVSGILGRNGSGKSCLMRLIIGTLDCRNQSVRINGQSVLKNKELDKNFKYLHQQHFIPGFLTLKRLFNNFSVSFDDFIKVFPEFSGNWNSKINQLAGGEKRIVEIYLTLCSKSKFCLLDEPFSQLMPLNIEKIKELIQREKLGKGITLTDHRYEDLLDVSDSVYVIKSGKTQLIKSVEDLKYLGYIN